MLGGLKAIIASVASQFDNGVTNEGVVHSSLEAVEQAYASLDASDKSELIDFILSKIGDDTTYAILWCSYLLRLEELPDIEKAVVELIRSGAFSPGQKWSFYWYALMSNYTHVDFQEFYSEIYHDYEKLFSSDLNWISPEERDQDRVVVLTNQFLQVKHAPTRRCLDYCEALSEGLGKNVSIINVADFPRGSSLALYKMSEFSYMEEYNKTDQINGFSYYQCKEPMPNVNEMAWIFDHIRDVKPLFVLSIGHSNITADLCSKMTTVVTTPCAASLSTSKASLLVRLREERDGDANFLASLGVTEDRVVSSEYLFRKPDTNDTFTRAELGLPEDKFIVAIVGNRLAGEIDEEFISRLVYLAEGDSDLCFVFAGYGFDYEGLVANNSELADCSAYVGYQEDILAFYGCCDAYLNPVRDGGGSSAAQALCVGVPVFTRPVGDVASAVGEEMSFSSDQEIASVIADIKSNPEIRDAWKARAFARFDVISDRERVFGELLAEIEARLDIRV